MGRPGYSRRHWEQFRSRPYTAEQAANRKRQTELLQQAYREALEHVGGVLTPENAAEFSAYQDARVTQLMYEAFGV